MRTIAVIDYGMSNHRSVYNALTAVSPVGTRVTVTCNPKEVERADRVVLPGQGAAEDCMKALDKYKLAPLLREKIQTRPLLGICMGLQVLLDFSHENHGTKCLGAIPGESVHLSQSLPRENHFKVPHMGWDRVSQCAHHPLWNGIRDQEFFYFAHSYHSLFKQEDLVFATTDYGTKMVSAVARDFIFAVQFHPEKSSAAGQRLLHNFANWAGPT